MDPNTYQILVGIKKNYPDQYGKIYQKLLGKTFEKIGFVTQERSIQGVDLHISRRKSEKYALEVKTTEKEEVNLEDKDVNGVREREADGYLPGFAALRLGLLAQWVIASAQNITSGKVPIPLLESQSFTKLQGEVRESFSIIASDIGKKLLLERPENPQVWLDEKFARFTS